jgi:hypothetical protein
MGKARKIKAQRATASQLYERLRQLRGKARFTRARAELKADR